jgi:hypothetical protein
LEDEDEEEVETGGLRVEMIKKGKKQFHNSHQSKK